MTGYFVYWHFSILLSIPHIDYNKKKDEPENREDASMNHKGENLRRSKAHICVDTPIGRLAVLEERGAVCAIRLARAEDAIDCDACDSPVLTQAARELGEYFDGRRTAFTFPMRAEGTAFQKLVWQALSEIPLGEVRTYGQIAQRVGNPKGSRAVGYACNRNPIMITVPCHRVVGTKGKLVGYAYGTDMKQQLLDLEQRMQ